MAIIKQDIDNTQEESQMNMGGNSMDSAQTPSTVQPQAPARQSQESSQIGGGQAGQMGQQKPNAPKKGVGSGMASKLNKYKAANTQQVGQMGQKMTQNVQKRAQDVQAETAKKSQQFEQRTAGEKARLNEGRDFSQNLINQANTQVDTGNLQKQRTTLDERIAGFGDLQEGGYQADVDANKSAYDAQVLANQGYQTEIEDATNRHTSVSARHADNYKTMTENWADDGGVSKNAFMASQAELQAAKNNLTSAQSAYDTGATDLEKLNEINVKQGQYELKQQALQDLAGVQSQLANQSGPTSRADLQKFADLREGRGDFQDIKNIDLVEQGRRGKTLEGLASRIQSTKGQEELLRDVVGRSDYNRGQSRLDSFLIGSNKDARENLIRGVQGSTAGLTQGVEDASRTAGETLGTIKSQARDVKANIASRLQGSQEALDTSLNQRLESGQGIAAADIQNRLNSGQGLTQEQLGMLGLQSGDKTYGADIGGYNAADYSQSDVADVSDLKRANALASLAGRQQTRFADPSAIGQKSTDGYSSADQNYFDQIKQQIAGRKAEEAGLASGGNAASVQRAYDAERTRLWNAYKRGDTSGSARRKWESENRAKYGSNIAAANQRDSAAAAARMKFNKLYGTDTIRGES